MTSQVEFDIFNMNKESLAVLQPDQMITLVLALREENEKFRRSSQEEMSKAYDERLEKVERELNLQKQYERRSSIEITGIPLSLLG